MTCGACGLESFNKSGLPWLQDGLQIGTIAKSWYYSSQAHLLFGIRYPLILSTKRHPIGSMYAIYANIWGILMVNATIYIYHTWILWALTLLIWFRICIPLSSFLSMLLTLPRSTFLPAPWSAIHHTGRPTIAPRRQAASGCCSGTAVAKAGSSARRFSSEAKWGNLGGFTRWSLGGIYGIEIYWNILTYYWNDRDFQPTIEIIWVSSFGKECVSNHWKWSKMKALRFFKSLKQWGFMMRDIRRVLENMYINFYHKWWIWPSRIVEMSCYFFLGSKMTTRKLFEQHWSFQIFQIIKPEINIENISATTNGPPARSMVSMSATLLLDLNPKPSRVGELWDDASAGEDYNFKDISVLSLPILSSAGIWWCIYIYRYVQICRYVYMYIYIYVYMYILYIQEYYNYIL